MRFFTYDKANQLATSTTGDKVTNYAYDAAGRLIKEGSVASGFKTYSYGYLDKILEVQENGEQIAAFDYHVGAQIAKAIHGDKTENFLWDGLALIHRGDNSFVNEPYVTGGNPILSSKDGVMFNDMLGTTLGVAENGKFTTTPKTAFGQPTASQPNNSTTEIDKVGFFTGKPYIGELGYAFLFRNYRADQDKWQTKDPLGYPDGWNNLAYVNNGVTSAIDWLGGETMALVSSFGKWSKWTPWYEIARSPDLVNPWILWEKTRNRENIMQNYLVDVTYEVTDSDEELNDLQNNMNILLWLASGPALRVGNTFKIGVWTITGLVTGYNISSGTNKTAVKWENWTPTGSTYPKPEVERETISSYARPE